MKCEICPDLPAYAESYYNDASQKLHFWTTMQPMRMLLVCDVCAQIVHKLGHKLGVRTQGDSIAGMCLEPIPLPGQAVPSVCVIAKGHDGEHRPHR